MNIDDEMTRHHALLGCDILNDNIEDDCYSCYRYDICLTADKKLLEKSTNNNQEGKS